MLNFLIFALLFVAGFIGLVMIFGIPVHWYFAFLLAKRDFIFTQVPEGKFKEVVRLGAHKKTLLAKEGHKIDPNGNIVNLQAGEKPQNSLPGGLHIIGWPGIDKIYRGHMKFLKSMPQGSVKAYDEEDVDAFYAKVDYPYAVSFVNCEDKNNLPLIGHATLLANVSGPVRSLFKTANFYETMIGLVLPSIRECLKGHGFDELKQKDDLDEIIWQALNEPNPDAPNGVIRQMFDNYGVEIVALRIVNIDPADEEMRQLTLTKYKAEREADAADAVARRDAMLTGGTLTKMVEDQISATETIMGKLTKDQKHQVRQDCLNMLLRERAAKAGGLKDIRIANADGSSFAGGSISEIVGGIVAAVAASASAKQDSPTSNTGNSGSQNPGGKKPSKNPAKAKTDEEKAEEHFKMFGKYPTWDPLQRKPN